MTNVEKLLNKDELIAYKNYDNKSYSLIPGISKDKNILERNKLHTATDDPNLSPLKNNISKE